MLTDTPKWSHTRGNKVVPSRWQATTATQERTPVVPARWNATPQTRMFLRPTNPNP